jgi:nicotinate-nucleotide pyrophosphorylase (carboxylating)
MDMRGVGDFGALTEEKLRELLSEDLGYGDITSEALIDYGRRAKAVLYFKEEGVTAGLEEAAAILTRLGCDVSLLEADGKSVPPGAPLMEAEGLARALLSGERAALNLVGRMAGIATATAAAVSRAREANPGIRVAATRKTAPGLRALDKRAVELGGGDPHRFRLDDCVLIKDNHLNFGLTVREAVERARRCVSFTKKVEVEVRTTEEAVEAAEAGADVIMFDNMPPAEIRDCLSDLDGRGLREGRLFEASGNITSENVVDYAATGVDIVSMGCLTHSARSLNVKLEIEPT